MQNSVFQSTLYFSRSFFLLSYLPNLKCIQIVSQLIQCLYYISNLDNNRSKIVLQNKNVCDIKSLVFIILGQFFINF